jgi:radical SAM protein with 4Fe4S-binding SPASM domain
MTMNIDAYTEEEKKAILEKAPYTMGIVGPKTAKKLLKIAEEDKEYPFHNPPMVCGYEVTHACNLKCRHCYNASGVRGPHELNTEGGKKVIDQIHDAGCSYIIFGGGEPFTRKDLFEFMEYAHKKDINMAVSTNATLIDKEKAKKIKDLELYSVQIGVDGTEDVHDTIRGVKGAWKKTMTAIYHLLDAEVPVTAIFTVMNSNVANIEKYIDSMKEEFGDIVYLIFTRAIYAGRAQTQGEVLSAVEWLDAANRITEKLDFYNWSHIPFCYILDSIRLNRIVKEFMKTPLGEKVYPEQVRRDVLEEDIPVEEAVYHLVGGVCKAGLWHMAVDPDGNITPCAEMGISLGNIQETTIDQVWKTHEVFRKLRKRHEEIQGKCKTCTFLSRCGGGCRGNALRFYGDILASDPSCIPPQHQGSVDFDVI